MRRILARILKDIKNYYMAILLFLIWNVIIRKVFHAFCPFLIVTGLPCAGCGMTRAVFYILTGDFARGMRLNPAAPFWIAWIVYFIVNRYFIGKNSKWVMRLLGIVCVITIGIYCYRMWHDFPGSPPMTFYRRNIMSKFFPFYNDLLQHIVQLW